MNQILPGLYLGSLDDSLDRRQIRMLDSVPSNNSDVIKNIIHLKLLNL